MIRNAEYVHAEYVLYIGAQILKNGEAFLSVVPPLMPIGQY